MAYVYVPVKQEIEEPVPAVDPISYTYDSGGGDSRAAKKPRNGDLQFPLPLGFLQPIAHQVAAYGQYEMPQPLDFRYAESPGDNGGEVQRRVGGCCRQFWKAGDFEADNAGENCSSSSSAGLDRVRVHPKFLHSNATSHKWALGALAELLDNSLDEVCNGATYVNVDVLKNKKDGSNMLLIEDNGGGMSLDKIRRCMSLGYSAKSKQANTIGQYGNGFKTSTMRLGADVIVFSRFPGNASNNNRQTQTIGMLSYSFLTGTGKEDIVVPMLDYEKSSEGWTTTGRLREEDWNTNLDTITQWSPYSAEADLLQQFDRMQEHGTRVIIYNLWEDDDGQLELDFDADQHDIQIRGVNRDEKNIQMAQQYHNSRHYLTYRHSLRSYASILYLRLPNQFRMILRGKDVEHHSLVNDMMLTKVMTYRPKTDSISLNVQTDVTIGFVKDAEHHIDVQGFSVYHKNRLIKPFWRVWNAAGSAGRGILGVLEADFVEPAHDKQGFERTTVLAKLENRLNAMQKTYWSSNCQKVGYVGSSRGKSKKLLRIEAAPAADHGTPQMTLENGVRSPRCADSVERPSEVEEKPAVTDLLLNRLSSERKRRVSLETDLREIERKAEELDKVQIDLIDMLEMERSQRQEEENRLQKKLEEAYKTIADLHERVRELEAMAVVSVKIEK